MQCIKEYNEDRLPGPVIVDALKITRSSALQLNFGDTSNSEWSISYLTSNKVFRVIAILNILAFTTDLVGRCG